MPLIQETIKYIKDEIYFKYLILALLIETIMNIYISIIIVSISNGESNLIIYYIIFNYLIQKQFSQLIIKPITIELKRTIKFKHYCDYTHLYAKLTYECKNSKNHHEFMQNINEAEQAMCAVIEWGLNEIMNLLSAFIGIIITFSKKKLLVQLFMFLISYYSFYFYIIKDKQTKHTKLEKHYQKIRNKTKALEALSSIPFQYNELSPEFLIKLKKESMSSNNIITMSWYNIININTFITGLITAINVYYCSYDKDTFMLLVNNMNLLINSIDSVLQFMTVYQSYNNDYNNFEEFWNTDLEFEKEIIKSNLSEHSIEINKVEIHRNDYVIKSDESFKLIIKKGSKILIQGPTGDGKSTFVKAIFGLIKTSIINYVYGSGINFNDLVSYYFQEIKEKTISSKVSIRDYFKGDINNLLIQSYLLNAWGYIEYDRILASLKKSNNDYITHPYDLYINDILSGGQKSRLILWTRGYNVDILNKEIIVLDEPCPDVDFTTYIDTMRCFYKKYNHCAIIFIGHLCDCKRKALGITFETEIFIEKGIISSSILK